MRPQTTVDRFPPRGLDVGARGALLRALSDAGASYDRILQRLLNRDAYADLADYLDAVEASWGITVAENVRSLLEDFVDRHVDDLVLDPEMARRQAFDRYGAHGMLLAMPEGDFLTALEVSARVTTNGPAAASLPERLNRICERRAVPYRVTQSNGEITFSWHGDAAVSNHAIAPALGALDEPRLADGPRREFRQALHEMRQATPETLKQAVAEACNAVESTMKVALDANDVPRPKRENAQDLFEALVKARLTAKDAEELVLSAARFGNRRGRHGAGPVAHNVAPAEAEAVVAAAATAILLLASSLP
jgi:uncharacterized membrane protein